MGAVQSQRKTTTKTERDLEAAIQVHANDPERVLVLERAKRFKRTWIELGETLVKVRDDESWRRWGHSSFDEYCARELRLKAGTVDKLCASYGFLRANAPRLVRDDGAELTQRIPSWQAVDFVARAEERGAVDDETLVAMKRAVFEEGAELPKLSRRYREQAFPAPVLSATEQRGKTRDQIAAAARRLADLVAEEDAGLPRGLAEKVEAVLGELVVWAR